ncbi:MAG: spermidine/putrescine ABC transporter substrate-binding protein [Spirochaetales bacterium]|jgi:spermidine/putrescine transport system substrate-binding protein|nr:spermidine/putrescine ABC transporter substrate-binding protein [Spirochaetales bacterium]
MKNLRQGILALIALLAFAGCSESQITLNVYNWGDYIDETVLADFESATGMTVNYETFATNEDMYIKVKQGGTKYDVIVPSDYMIARLIKEDLLEKIDVKKISTYRNIGKRYLGLDFDPTNEYSVPYMWGTFGILYNTKMVDEPVESWAIMWNPKYEKQILMMDSVRDSLAVAFLRLGYSINTTNTAELEKAAELLAAQKPLVLAYVGDNGKDMMVAEEAALAMSWSGDAVAVREQNPDLEYVIPKEGTNLWVDSMVIPKNSEHKKEALLFIDFMNRPETAQKNAEYIGYATPNTAAYELLDEETRSDPAAYPPGEALARWEVFVDIGAANAEYNRVWTEIKSR